MSFSLKQLKEFPPPPRTVYKYLSAERVKHVLRDRLLRFTPLMNTNDTFEVRSTFRRLAGPNFRDLLVEQFAQASGTENLKEPFIDQLMNQGISRSNATLIFESLDEQTIRNLRSEWINLMMGTLDSELIPSVNEPAFEAEVLAGIYDEHVCLSLSATKDSAAMWAHYADNNRGFVVAFRTDDSWFSSPKDQNQSRLIKVSYLDGQLDEAFEDIAAALVSKTAEWSYEQEWRIYDRPEHANLVVGPKEDPVHLFRFPVSCMDRIIIGAKATEETIESIKAELRGLPPEIGLFQAQPDGRRHSYDEIPLTK